MNRILLDRWPMDDIPLSRMRPRNRRSSIFPRDNQMNEMFIEKGFLSDHSIIHDISYLSSWFACDRPSSESSRLRRRGRGRGFTSLPRNVSLASIHRLIARHLWRPFTANSLKYANEMKRKWPGQRHWHKSEKMLDTPVAVCTVPAAILDISISSQGSRKLV